VKIETEDSMYPYSAPTSRTARGRRARRDEIRVRPRAGIRPRRRLDRRVISMEQVLQSPVMFIGLSLPEHGYHAPNENYDWAQASGGIVAFVKYFDNVSRMPRRQ
jgi:hypothetical protein